MIVASKVKLDLRLFPSLLSGALASLAAPAFIIWKLNQKDAPLFGDAKFASDSDLKNQKLLKWEKENDTDILVGRYKGKYLWYTAPDFVSLGSRNASGERGCNRNPQYAR
ncbi:hypothetical protein [Escherichia coli]|uniref:hypothetical protein n=1 Tax=Escherichia coli TaxID=562 RepID=UPI00389050F2